MQLIYLICLFFIVSIGESIFQLPLKIYNVPKETLKMRHGQRLLEDKFINDFVTADISIGTPPQNFTVLISSSSEKSWVFDKNYLILYPPAHNKAYNSSKSKSSKKLNKEFYQQDGTFSVSGQFYTDKIHFVKDLIDQPFGSVDNVLDVNNAQFPVDGVVGLNHFIDSFYKDKNEPAALIDSLLKQEKQKLVTYYLAEYVPPKQASSQEGLITIGGHDNKNCKTSAIAPAIKLDSNDDDGRFVLQINSVQYGSEVLKKGGNAYLDSGVSNLIVPTAVLQTIISKTGATYDFNYGLYTAPCSWRDDLKQISIYVGKIRGPSIYFNPTGYLKDIGLSDDKCVLVVEAEYGDNQEDYVLGTPVMRAVCSTFDMQKNTVTFYNHK